MAWASGEVGWNSNTEVAKIELSVSGSEFMVCRLQQLTSQARLIHQKLTVSQLAPLHGTHVDDKLCGSFVLEPVKSCPNNMQVPSADVEDEDGEDEEDEEEDEDENDQGADLYVHNHSERVFLGLEDEDEDEDEEENEDEDEDDYGYRLGMDGHDQGHFVPLYDRADYYIGVGDAGHFGHPTQPHGTEPPQLPSDTPLTQGVYARESADGKHSLIGAPLRHVYKLLERILHMQQLPGLYQWQSREALQREEWDYIKAVVGHQRLQPALQRNQRVLALLPGVLMLNTLTS